MFSMNVKNVLMKRVAGPQFRLMAQKVIQVKDFNSYEDAVLDLELWNKISIYDPKFRVLPKYRYQAPNLNVIKLTDCDHVANEHLTKFKAFKKGFAFNFLKQAELSIQVKAKCAVESQVNLLLTKSTTNSLFDELDR